MSTAMSVPASGEGPDDKPYNPNNVLLTEHEMNELFDTYEMDFNVRDINIYRKAFVHKSYMCRVNENFVDANIDCPENTIPLQEISYERIECLGDSILGFVVLEYLYNRYDGENEGFLTKMRTKLVNGNMLAKLSKDIGLGKWAVISKQIEEKGGRMSKNILEDVFESIIGAIYIDSGSDINTAKKWIINIIEDHVDFSELVNTHNPKDTLVKYFQHNFQILPRFEEIDCRENARGEKTFTICVKNDKNVVIGIGNGDTKKGAEHDASKKALVAFGVTTDPCD